MFSQETYSQGRFTLVFLGYGNPDSDPSIELTYNWDSELYHRGTRYGHVALEVDDIQALCDGLSKQGVPVLREPGPMSYIAATCEG